MLVTVVPLGVTIWVSHQTVVEQAERQIGTQLDGLRNHGRIRRREGPHHHIWIIAMTANVMASDVKALKASGFSGLIGKPIVRQVFPDLLKQILTGQPVWFIS